MITLENLIARHGRLMAEATEFARLQYQRLGAAGEVAAMIESLKVAEPAPATEDAEDKKEGDA